MRREQPGETTVKVEVMEVGACSANLSEISLKLDERINKRPLTPQANMKL